MVDSIQGFFDGLQATIDPNKTAGMTAIFQFNATGDGGGEWFVQIEDGKTHILKGTAQNPTITMTAEAQDWLDMVNGDLSGQTAFLTGKLRIEGDVTLAMKLESLFNLG